MAGALWAGVIAMQHYVSGSTRCEAACMLSTSDDDVRDLFRTMKYCLHYFQSSVRVSVCRSSKAREDVVTQEGWADGKRLTPDARFFQLWEAAAALAAAPFDPSVAQRSFGEVCAGSGSSTINW